MRAIFYSHGVPNGLVVAVDPEAAFPRPVLASVELSGEWSTFFWLDLLPNGDLYGLMLNNAGDAVAVRRFTKGLDGSYTPGTPVPVGLVGPLPNLGLMAYPDVDTMVGTDPYGDRQALYRVSGLDSSFESEVLLSAPNDILAARVSAGAIYVVTVTPFSEYVFYKLDGDDLVQVQNPEEESGYYTVLDPPPRSSGSFALFDEAGGVFAYPSSTYDINSSQAIADYAVVDLVSGARTGEYLSSPAYSTTGLGGSLNATSSTSGAIGAITAISSRIDFNSTTATNLYDLSNLPEEYTTGFMTILPEPGLAFAGLDDGPGTGPQPEPECFWTDLQRVSQVCGAQP